MSRNVYTHNHTPISPVAPREGRVSRNLVEMYAAYLYRVAPREGRVSRNLKRLALWLLKLRRAPRGACE